METFSALLALCVCVCVCVWGGGGGGGGQFVGKTDASIEMRCSACEADCTTTY